MDEVTVRTKDLLEAIKGNRDGHREEFLAAQKGWKQTILEELERRLADARAGRKVAASFHYPEPEDHTKDYDRVIKMLEMEVNDTVDVDQTTFAEYVMDDWSWKAQWSASNSAYVTRASR